MSARTLVVCLLVASPLFAKKVRHVPVTERVARNDLVVVGTVVEVEEDAVEIDPYRYGYKSWYQVARVKIDDNLFGASGLTHVRVAFVNVGDFQYDVAGSSYLEKGGSALLFLHKPREGDHYVLDRYQGAVDKESGTAYDDALAEAKVACRALADPIKALKSDKADDRMTAAWTLVTKHRTYPTTKEIDHEPIDATESRLILENLPLLADKDASTFAVAFNLLNLSDKEGWTGSAWDDAGRERAKTWLKDHASTYRIKRLMAK